MGVCEKRRSFQNISSHVIWNTDIYWRRYKTQETLYIGQWHLSPLQSRHLGISHSSPYHHQLPCDIFLNLTNGLKSLPFQRWFYFWEKTEVARCQICAVAGLSHLADLMFLQRTLHSELHQWMCCDKAASQLPIAPSFWLMGIVSTEECSGLTQTLMQTRWSSCSVIRMQGPHTTYTYSLNRIYSPYQLALWRHHISRMRIQVQSPWLPGCIHVSQIILILFTMVGLFQDTPCVSGGVSN